MASVFELQLAGIPELCRRYGVARLELFGSATGDAFDPQRSDIDFRNVLTHGYDLIDHRIVWSTIDEEVPVLLAEFEALLK